MARKLPPYVYPHPSGYRVDYWPEGRAGKRRCRTFRRLDEALAFWSNVHGPDPEPATVSHLIDSYICGRLFEDLAERTRSDYHKQLAKIRAALGEMRPQDVTTRHIVTIHEHRGKASTRQANYLLSVAQQAFKWGRMQGLIKGNPCDGVQRFKERPRDRYVTDAEFAAVLDLAPPSVRLAMMLTGITGLRQGDILALTFSDFTDDGLLVATGKTGQRMLFEWTDGLRACHDYARTMEPKVRGIVVCTGKGQPYCSDGFRSAWHRLMARAEAAGVERFTFHDLRAKAGSDSRDWRLLGHATRKTFDRVYDRLPKRVRPVR